MIKNYLRKKLNHPLFNSKFCIVSGIGRSGTTVLRKSLELHPLINSTRTENNLVYDLLEALDTSVTRRSNAIKVPIGDHFNLFKNLIIETSFPYCRDLNKVNTICCDLSEGALSQLTKLFNEQCNVLYIIRNGIEVVASRMLKPQFTHFSFEDNCRIWARSMKVVDSAKKHSNFLVVRHENMYREKSLQNMYQKMCNHLDLEVQESCIEFALNTYCHPTMLNDEDCNLKSIKSRIQRWATFSDKQKTVFGEICGDAMDFFNYRFPPDQE